LQFKCHPSPFSFEEFGSPFSKTLGSQTEIYDLSIASAVSSGMLWDFHFASFSKTFMQLTVVLPAVRALLSEKVS
jgi:hypothetical protein